MHDTVRSYACTSASLVTFYPETPTLDHAVGILEFGQSVAVLGETPGERNERKASLDLA